MRSSERPSNALAVSSISLDPDDDEPDATTFDGLSAFLDNVFSDEERSHFLAETAPSMIRRAMQLKQLKPPAGFHFSLQQQGATSRN